MTTLLLTLAVGWLVVFLLSGSVLGLLAIYHKSHYEPDIQPLKDIPEEVFLAHNQVCAVIGAPSPMHG